MSIRRLPLAPVTMLALVLLYSPIPAQTPDTPEPVVREEIIETETVDENGEIHRTQTIRRVIEHGESHEWESVDVPHERRVEKLKTRQDDLITGGLGLVGLKGPAPLPSEDEINHQALRTLALHTQWNGLSALHRDDGLGPFNEGGLPVVAGWEIMTYRRLADSHHSARALLQIPDGFDVEAPCLVAGPASGSRGVYGATPLVGPWALPKGCAVVYTDKGAGTDYVDAETQTGVAIDGRRVGLGEPTVAFVPSTPMEQADTVATAHAHSQTHVEAHWGTYTLDAIEWALAELGDHFEHDFSSDTVAVLAAGLSNGGQAVLKAIEQDSAGLIDGAVAVMPNITPLDTPSLFAYAATAALYQPCAMGDPDWASGLPLINPLMVAFAPNRCQSLYEAGLLDEPSPQKALAHLKAFGFDDDGLTFSASTVVLDIWRTVLANYASAYMQTGAEAMPCGYRLAAGPEAASSRATWWATGSGSPPGGGVVLMDTQMAQSMTDPHFAGLKCLYDLQNDPKLTAGIEATRAQARWPQAIPVAIIHGQHDGLIPATFSSRPYVAQAQAHGMKVNYTEVPGAQHFDAFLNVLPASEPYVAILPYGWAGMDAVWADMMATGE